MLTRIVPRYPALVINGNEKSLVIADLHLGFEAKLSSNNIYLGKNTSVTETAKDIEKILDKTKPESLILLGDIKSGIKSITKTEWNTIPTFFEIIKKRIDVTVIPGNHDANIEKLIPRGITLASSKGIVIENMLLTHGHTMPSENFSHVNKIIMGHLHPVYFEEKSLLNGKRVWVSLKSKKHNIFPTRTGELEIIFFHHLIDIFMRHKKKSIRNQYHLL